MKNIICALLSCSLFGSLLGSVSHEKEWTIQTSLAVRYLMDRERSVAYSGTGKSDSVVTWSPDSRYVFFKTIRGDLESDQPVEELRVFSRDTIKAALDAAQTSTLKPLHVVVRSGYASPMGVTGIYEAKWSSDSRRILFTGCLNQRGRVLQMLDVTTGEEGSLSSPDQDVQTYTEKGGVVLYSAPHYPAQYEIADQYPTVVANSNLLERMIKNFGQQAESFTMYSAREGEPAKQVGTHYDWQMPTPDDYIAKGRAAKTIWFSPSGRVAMVLRATNDFGRFEKWAGYDRLGALLDRGVTDGTSWGIASRRFLLVDLSQGKMRPIFNAPAGTATESGRQSNYVDTSDKNDEDGQRLRPDVLWFPDESRAIVVNTALPLDESEEQRKHVPFIIDYDIKRGDYSIVLPSMLGERRVRSVQWHIAGESLLVEYYASNNAKEEIREYRREGGKWVAGDLSELPKQITSAPGSVPFQVKIKEDENTPATVIASDGVHSVPLLAPDSALEGVYINPVQWVEWTEADGWKGRGALVLPRNQLERKPLPLVIQIQSGLGMGRFLPDGLASGGYAAQLLAAQGVAVLTVQAGIARRLENGEPSAFDEGPCIVRRVDAAVTSLAERGLIDPKRVGLIGFSRNGYNAAYVASHPGQVTPAAAVIVDSTMNSYSEYVAMAAYADSLDEVRGSFETGTGAYAKGSFWRNKGAWLEGAPLFNADRIRTPLLFMYHGGGATNIGFWSNTEIPGALALNERVFELVLFPRTEHQLFRPSQRLESMQTSVDWLLFWLSDRLPVDPARCERWKLFKLRQSAIAKESLPQPGHWIFQPTR